MPMRFVGFGAENAKNVPISYLMGSRMLKNDLNDLLKRSKNHSYKDIKGEGVSVIGMETCKVRYDLENLESGIQDEFKTNSRRASLGLFVQILTLRRRIRSMASI